MRALFQKLLSQLQHVTFPEFAAAFGDLMVASRVSSDTAQMADEEAEEDDGKPKKPWKEYRALLQRLHDNQDKVDELLRDEPISHGSVYMHLSNGGCTASITDEGSGPIVSFSSHSFGAQVTDFRFHTDPETLAVLAALFAHAAKQPCIRSPYATICTLYEVMPPEGDLASALAKLGLTFDDVDHSKLPPREDYENRISLNEDE